LLRWATPMLTMGASAFCKRLASSKTNRSHGISHQSPASTGLQLRRTPHSFARLGRPSGHAKSGVNTSKPTPIWASNEVSTSFSAHQGPRPSGHGFISLLSKQKPLRYGRNSAINTTIKRTTSVNELTRQPKGKQRPQGPLSNDLL
jgi:hypothetical protein